LNGSAQFQEDAHAHFHDLSLPSRRGGIPIAHMRNAYRVDEVGRNPPSAERT
jgi:hypothetical protein